MSNQSNLNRHQKACLVFKTKLDSDSDDIDTLTKTSDKVPNTNEVSVLRDMIGYLKNELSRERTRGDRLENQLRTVNEQHKDTIAQDARATRRLLEEEITDRKQVVTSAGSLVGKSLSTIEYLTKHMSNAPALKPITDMSIIQKSEGDGQFEMSDIVAYHGKKNTLHEYIGNIIVAHYKNENEPGKQSIWASDVARLSYVIRQNIDDNDVWIEDKNGLKVKETVIIPLLEHISEELRHRIQEEQDNEHETTPEDMRRLWEISTVLQQIGTLKTTKQISKLAQRINRHIAGHFYLDKPKN